jgi:MFS family permease
MLGGAAVNAACLLALCLVAQPPLALILALVVLVGLGGGFMIVAYDQTRELYGSARSATAMGVVNSAVLLIGAGLQSLIGVLLDASAGPASSGPAPDSIPSPPGAPPSRAWPWSPPAPCSPRSACAG